MKKLLFVLILPILFSWVGCKNEATPVFVHENLSAPDSDPNYLDKIYIPKDIDDCFAELDRMLSQKQIKKIKRKSEGDLIEYHFGLGMWIRNSWGLWRESRLSEYLFNLGFRHPDDKSSAILDSYWRYLNNKPIELEKAGKASQYYWQILEKPENPICPEHNVPIEIKYALHGSVLKNNETLPRCIYVGRCSETKMLWIYEHEQGWSKPEGVILERINELEAEGTERLESAPIEKP